MAVPFAALFPTFYPVDVVAVYTQDFRQIFRRARAIKATIKEEAKLMEHPVENGAIITDHRIILPVEIELSLILTRDQFQDTYREIRQIYLNSTLVIVNTKTGVYKNQIIQAMPHDEDPETFDIIALSLKLKQVQFAMARFGVAPKRAANTSTVDRGTQQGTPTPVTTLGNLGHFAGLGKPAI